MDKKEMEIKIHVQNVFSGDAAEFIFNNIYIPLLNLSYRNLMLF